jgi:ABC-2 type transport system permease protein
VTHLNPVLYLISGFRWSFFELSDVPVGVSLMAVTGFLALGLAVVWIIFKTGWRIRS